MNVGQKPLIQNNYLQRRSCNTVVTDCTVIKQTNNEKFIARRMFTIHIC